jgi:hypothetical protein
VALSTKEQKASLYFCKLFIFSGYFMMSQEDTESLLLLCFDEEDLHLVHGFVESVKVVFYVSPSTHSV